jgi:ABC-2 type transport system ATP-binding protein
MSAALSTRTDCTSPAVATRSLRKSYGKETALDGVDLQVPSGAVYLLAGPNGAGKSTLLKILLNLVQADAGRAEVFGLDCGSHGPRVRAQIGYVPEGHTWMRSPRPVSEVIRQHAAFYPAWDAAYAERLIRAYGVPLDRGFDGLSKGETRRIQLVLALAHRPPLLLLDEPTDGLDPVARDATLAILAEHLAETPTTVLVSTHHVAEIERLADHVGVLQQGSLRLQTPVEELHREMLRYRLLVPDCWEGAAEMSGMLFQHSGSGRERTCTVMGEKSWVVERLSSSGATVREAAPLRLEEAVLTLLARKE